MPNQVLIWGHVDSDINERTTTTGKPVADFRINDGKGWYTVTCWGDSIPASQIPPRGSFVVVGGRLQNRSYEPADGGKKVTVTEITASTLTVPGAEESAAPRQPAASADPMFGD